MTDSQQPRIIKSGQARERSSSSGRFESSDSESPKQVEVGHRYGMWTTISPVLKGKKYYEVDVRCACGIERRVSWDNLRAGKSSGCRSCSLRKSTPAWLRSRVSCMKSRCTNSNHPSWASYGGRGIEFRFASVAEGAAWIQDNLGLHKDLELDRIDSNGHYEPGNLRWATDRQQVFNRDYTKLDEEWIFRQEEWPYAEVTVRRKLQAGLTRAEILQEAAEYVESRGNWWMEVLARSESMTSSTPARDVDSPSKDD